MVVGVCSLSLPWILAVVHKMLSAKFYFINVTDSDTMRHFMLTVSANGWNK